MKWPTRSQTSSRDGKVPLVLGGDCTITIGAVAGLRRRHPDGGLVYLDGDTDLGVPGDDSSGILDSMGISHMLGRGARELTQLGGTAPLLEPARLAIIGADPRETTDAGREYLRQAGVDLQEAPELIADPAGAAKRAVQRRDRLERASTSSTSTSTSSTLAICRSATSRTTARASRSRQHWPRCTCCARILPSPGSC